MTVNNEAVRGYFYDEVRGSADGGWYPHWWGVVDVATYIASCEDKYKFTPTFGDDDDADYSAYEDDAYERPTHYIISADIPCEDGVAMSDNVHGAIYPVVIEGDTVRAWAGHTIDETLGGGPSLQDEEYDLARQWVLDYGVAPDAIITEPVPGL